MNELTIRFRASFRASWSLSRLQSNPTSTESEEFPALVIGYKQFFREYTGHGFRIEAAQCCGSQDDPGADDDIEEP
jgi:hypothetical protein